MPTFKTGYHCIAGFVLMLLLLAGCATPQQTIQLIESPPDVPLLAELTSTPFYPQRDYQCGPAALATVINFHRQQTSLEELIPLVYIPQLKGSLQIEMLAAPRRFDRLAIQQDGKLSSILREVANGNPVLVMQNLGFDTYPFWHYAVVIGYDLNKQEIILRSGEIKRLVRPFSVFERTWQRSDHWSVVIVPPGVIPITASEEKYSKAVVELESTTSLDLSILAYQSGIQRWPDNFILQMGLGNVAYSLKDYMQAEMAFSVATKLQPNRAEPWNNFAYALSQQGKKQQALRAVKKAVELAPDNNQYRNSLKEISNIRSEPL